MIFTNILNNSLRAERAVDRIPARAKFSVPAQNKTGAHPESSTVGTGLFPRGKAVGGVALTTHPA